MCYVNFDVKLETCVVVKLFYLNELFAFFYVSATEYDDGVSFVIHAYHSVQDTFSAPDGTGSKRVYQAMVLTGDYTKGQSGLRGLPDNPAKPGTKFDSVVDDVNRPTMFIIFHDDQAYPNYLITFR